MPVARQAGTLRLRVLDAKVRFRPGAGLALSAEEAGMWATVCASEGGPLRAAWGCPIVVVVPKQSVRGDRGADVGRGHRQGVQGQDTLLEVCVCVCEVVCG